MTVDNVVASLEMSTSSAKCMLFSEAEGVVSQFSKAFEPDVADGPSQSADGIVAAALDVLGQAVKAADAMQASIEGIGITGTWHSLLLLDADRNPIGPIKTWADLSGAESVAPVRLEEDFVRTFYHRTGCMVHAMYPVWKWFHLRATEPELTSCASFLSSQVEYLFESLTGAQGVSRCVASGTGLLNINTLDWDDDVLEIAGIRREQLNPLVEAFHTAPLSHSIAESVGLRSGLPVTVGCSDGAMNQVAVGGFEERTMSMSVGTSGALRAAHAEPRIPPTPSTWCYYLFKGKRLAGAAVNNGTNCVDWFLNRAGHRARDADVYEAFSRGVKEVELGDAPFFIPFVFGERCPGWRENRRGGFVGIHAAHDEFDLYHAVLEGVLFNMRQCYEILEDLGGKPERILLSGGIMNSKEWAQMAADIFGREILASGVANDSTVGGALVALQAVTGGNQAEVYRPAIASRLVPRHRECRAYQRRYQRYLELYDLM